MDKGIERDLKYISGLLSDIEVIDLPWVESQRIGTSIEWDEAVWRLEHNFNCELTAEQTQRLADIKRRIKAQEDKIRVLDFHMPEF